MFACRILGVNKLQNRITQKIQSGPSLCAKINLDVGLPIFRQVKATAPVFRGYLQRNIMNESSSVPNGSIFWIRFPTSDPDRGHEYVWYAEYGRDAIRGKKNPKMRYYKSPKEIGAGTYGANNSNLIFRENVGPAKPTFFIRNAVQLGKFNLRPIAQKRVSEWLRA